MFKVGDIVIHPAHGICKVETLQNDKTPPSIYVLRPKRGAPGNFRVLIPKEKIKVSGVRYPISRNKIPDILRILEDSPNDLSKDREVGYVLTKKKVQSGDLKRIAQAIRDLEGQNSGKLNSVGLNLLKLAKRKIVEEIAYVKHTSKEKIEKLINEALNKKGRRDK